MLEVKFCADVETPTRFDEVQLLRPGFFDGR